MEFEIHYQPANTACLAKISPGETLTSEGGSMLAMDDHLSVTTSTHKKNKGSIWRSIKRMFAGESFFLNHYSAESAPGEVWLSSSLPGDMRSFKLEGPKLVVQSGSFVASEEEIDINVGWQGFKNLISGESLFWLELSGHGNVVVSSFGAIYEVEVNGEYIVDTGHIVAFEESLNFEISKAGSSWVSSYLGGEGLVCRFKGHGKLWCQSHSANEFGSSLKPHLRAKSR